MLADIDSLYFAELLFDSAFSLMHSSVLKERAGRLLDTATTVFPQYRPDSLVSELDGEQRALLPDTFDLYATVSSAPYSSHVMVLGTRAEFVATDAQRTYAYVTYRVSESTLAEVMQQLAHVRPGTHYCPDTSADEHVQLFIHRLHYSNNCVSSVPDTRRFVTAYRLLLRLFNDDLLDSVSVVPSARSAAGGDQTR